jgi:transposase InsO family protein
MPWSEVSLMTLRSEFLALARQPETNISRLSARFGISRKTAYKWLARLGSDDPAALVDRSRRPQHSPQQTSAALAAIVLAVRSEHPAWGGRKIRALLAARGERLVPSASTISAMLRRAGQLDPARTPQHRAFQRFEQPAANALWQMDFKGHIATTRTGRCHPLTVLDDHSRFNLCLAACPNEQTATVQAQLTRVFRCYGLPERILCDNGAPWGTAGSSARYAQLGVWLLSLGVAVSHGRPHHPQTQGKDERFHRTLVAEVLAAHTFTDLADCQQAFDHFRSCYNEERPHEALGLLPPASRYQVSPRAYPERLAALPYEPGEQVRSVHRQGYIKFQGSAHMLGLAFGGQRVVVRPTSTDAVWEVFFYHHRVSTIDCRSLAPE